MVKFNRLRLFFILPSNELIVPNAITAPLQIYDPYSARRLVSCKIKHDNVGSYRLKSTIAGQQWEINVCHCYHDSPFEKP